MHHSRHSLDPKSRTLVIGIGNDFRGDDGVGLYIARKSKESEPENAEILEASGEASELLRLWEKREKVIIVDAISSGADPGSVYRYHIGVDKIPVSQFDSQSTHSFGIIQAIELAEVFGTLPKKLVVYGIEGRNFEMGTGLSPEVEDAARDVVRRILNEI